MKRIFSRRILIVLISVILIATTSIYLIRRATAISCPTTSTNSGRPIPPDLIEGNTQFALELYQKMASTQQSNFIYSPYSISQAFAMVYLGADGDTKTQIEKTFRFTLPPEDTHAGLESLNSALAINAEQSEGSIWCNANAVWLEKTFSVNPAYIAQVKKYYDAGIQTTDFKSQPETARQTINQWVDQQTRHRIQELFARGTIDSTTQLALVNAVYFKSQWETAFSKSSTKDDSFTLLDSGIITVPMMNMNKEATFNYQLAGDYQLLELPYKNATSMLIILPNDGKYSQVETFLDGAFFNAIQLVPTSIRISMPRFEFDSTFDLPEMLKPMGLTKAFDPNQANFSKMKLSNEQADLFIQTAVHKAFIKTDEEGTEASAASGISIAVVTIRYMDIKLDRPFIFAIRDQQTGTILFMGRVLNPLQAH